jgi:hypothetical protein
VLAINLVHISPWAVTRALLDGAGRALPPGGLLYLYGPFMQAGVHISPSNAAFDRLLRGYALDWGVRDLDAVATRAEQADLTLERSVAMPANNHSVLFRRPA